MVEWANVRYAPTPELSVRAGRIALPALMNSEARFVGYATPWVRQPIEIYGTLAVTSNDGVDATYRHALGDGTNAVTAYAGNSTIKFKSGGGYTVKSRNAWGINDTYETGSLTLRAGYNALTLSIVGLDSGDELMGAFTQVAAGLQQVPIPTFQTAASQLLAVRDSNPLEGMKLSSFTLGANYDPGDWFVTGEAVLLRGDSFMVSSKGFVLGGGWRSHGWTPYAYVAKSLADFQSHPGIDTTGLAGVPGTEPLVGAIPMLMGGLDLMRQGFVSDQQTLALGVRWDFMKNAALKAQFERQRYGRGDGQLRQVPPGTSANGTSANVYSVAADFVF